MASLAGSVVVFALLGLVVWCLTAATLWAGNVRKRLLIRYLVHGVAAIRSENFLNRGLLIRKGRLIRLVTREVRSFLSQIQPLRGGVSWTSAWDAWLAEAHNPGALKEHSQRTWGDLWEGTENTAPAPSAATELLALFEGITRNVSAQFERTRYGLMLLWGIALAALGGVNGWAGFSGALSGILVAGAFSAIAAALWNLGIDRFLGLQRAVSEPEPFRRSGSSETEKPDSSPRIGEDHMPVQVLSFAGGGYDAVMQLGVAHAITVIQGRPPDAVIGLSTGALCAAALADILQAGEEQEQRMFENHGVSHGCPKEQWQRAPELKRKIQAMRLAARASRLRFFIDSAQKGPGLLVKALLPDAFQIDSHDPIASLREPRFIEREREERDQAAIRRSGLVRLYNDLLDLHLSIGAMTRFVRRALGLKTAGDFPTKWRRAVAYVVGWGRLLGVIALNLTRIAPLMPPLVRSVAGGKKATPRSAEGLIFNYAPLRQFGKWVSTCISFAVLLMIWLCLALLPIVLGSLLVKSFDRFGYLAAVPQLLLYVVVACVVLYHLVESEPRGVIATLAGVAKGTIAYVSFTLFWLVLPIAAVIAIVAFNPAVHLDFGRAWVLVGQTTRILWWGGAVLSVVALLFGIWLGHSDKPLLDRVLISYHIGSSLFQTYGFNQFLVDIFDKNYYGRIDRKTKPSMDDVVNSSLKGLDAGLICSPEPKLVGHFSSAGRRAPIYLGIAAANVTSGELEIITLDEKLIPALMAAISATPFFPPQEIGGQLYIDGSNIANEPMMGLLTLLRNSVNPNSTVVHIYAVSPFPVSMPKLGEEPNVSQYDNLIDVALRAVRLQKFRDATLERRLTELVTRSMPATGVQVPVEIKEIGDQKKTNPQLISRAWVTPIEGAEVRSLNRILLRASDEKRRVAIYEAIAGGCRAALQVMIPGEIQAKGVDEPPSASCGDAVSAYLKRVAPDLADLVMPGKHSDAPGLAEICRHCRLTQTGTQDACVERKLQLGDWETTGPEWPHERDYKRTQPEGDPHFIKRPEDRYADAIEKLNGWPPARCSVQEPDKSAGDHQDRPTISLLFSGGVFRGVHQLGVLSALNELGVRPDLIAGASVGSITAAMVARVFNVPDHERQDRIARLAAVYLAIDRLVLTDRFADFIRNFTLRASDTHFSIREADQFFRKYDYPSAHSFERNAREVLAGLERLFGISPYQVLRMSNAIREGDWPRFWEDLEKHVAQWLRNMEVGDEMLGAEPLAFLIDQFVTEGLTTTSPNGPTFEDLRSGRGPVFLGTTTNLTQGKLTVVGEASEYPQIIREGLLASSAFPSVFRPRWSWELCPEEKSTSQYIDGGVMDNLPLDEVTSFLAQAAKCGRISSNPIAPHLIVAASLETGFRKFLTQSELEVLRQNWVELWSRARTLRYNTKLDYYAFAERVVRSLPKSASSGANKAPIDIEIVPIKPEWLCGTFGFHPMLGFRRVKQKRSIAHGCASTLMSFAQIGQKARDAWNIGAVPKVRCWADAFHQLDRRRQPPEAGRCWLREGHTCPFALDGKASNGKNRPSSLPNFTRQELSHIWQLCPERETHLQRM